ncbi:MAG TPA: amidohydrolase family protein [Jatrophihabitans sp.]|uniref:amidohydrolase n=1 Tax=Jatrophihabitans sp. TaxID=1932789 RepID=UPI002DF7B4A3|nr:amidohydrolase family protein [Jatrophihabitans sp.]
MLTLYRNGRIHRVGRPPATALLTDGTTIAALGADDELPTGSHVAVVDLDGALVTPAFVDAHVHATSTGLALTGLDLRAATSLGEALTLLDKTARAARGRPILGGGWDETGWPEQRPPTAGELDRATYGSAVYLARVDVHSAVASSSLMAAVPGLRGLSGFAADGWLRGPAHDAVRAAAQEALTAGQRREAQRAALQRAAALGIACVHEMAGPVISSEDDVTGLLRLVADEPLPEVIAYWGELFGIEAARDLGCAGAAGDLFCDGSLGSHTAGLGAPYTDRPDTSGYLRFETADLAEHIARCAAAGLQAGFHAIGDAAIDQVLDALDRLGERAGAGHRLEHAEFVPDPRRFAASGLTASMQPVFDAAWGGPAGMYAQRLGPGRAAGLNRFADLVAAGVPLAFGSDAPVTELGPWAAVRAAAHPHEPSAAIPVGAAFTAHTTGGWRAAGRNGVGELAPGAPATFALWACGPTGADGLPRLRPDDELPRCLATVRDGRPIFDAGALDGSGASGP